MQDSEDKIQSTYHIWLWNTYPKLRWLCFAVPNGGLRGAQEAMKLKATGTVRGIPDYFHAVPLKGYGCLIIEFKEPGANMNTPHVIHQTMVQGIHRAAGNMVMVCDSFEKAKAIFLEYFKGSHWIKK